MTGDLTPAQAEALRLLVEDARCWDGMKVGKTTDRNLKEINGRVAKALAGHGLVEILDHRDGDPCDPYAIATDAGRDHVEGPTRTGLDDDARALLEEASRADAADEQLLEGDGTGEPLPPLPDDAYPDDAEPLDEEVLEVDDSYEGRTITAFESRILAAHRDAVRGSIPARHLGARIVAVVVMHVDQVQHDNLADNALQRTQKLRPMAVYPLPDVYSDGFRAVAAKLVSLAEAQPTLFAEEDLAGGLPQELIDRMNRAVLEAADEDGRRDWTEADAARAEEVRAAIADGDWHPARQFGRDVIQQLHRAGQVEVRPDWWVTGGDPGMEPEQAAEVIPHVRLIAADTAELETPADPTAAVEDLLADAEAQHPQVVVRSDRGGAWTVDVPDGYQPIPGTWWLPDAAKQAAEQILGALDWQATVGDRHVADLPALDVAS